MLRANILINYLFILESKTQNNPHYDVESAIQCLDLSPLSEAQVTQAIVYVNQSYKNWVCMRRSRILKEPNNMGFFLRKRKYERIRTNPSQTVRGLVDSDIL